MGQDTNKKHGRFIKASDPLRKVLTVTEFNLMDICEKPFTFHDNANANIIHQKLHAQAEMSETIRESHEIDANFPHENRPVIRPLDFTDEWRRQKRRLANRHQRMDDEEDMELDGRHEPFEWNLARFSIVEELHGPLYPYFETQGFDGKGKAMTGPIAEAPPPSKPTPPPLEYASRPSTVPQETELLPPRQQPAAAVREEFMPMHPATPVIDEKALEALREAARADGYRQGFQVGEEKGAMQVQQKVQGVLSELSIVMENLEGMQHSILGSVQENFVKICQSFIEALLQKEFQLHPESFGRVIERAIQEAVPEDEFKILVNPQILESLGQWSDRELLSRLRADDSLQDYAFRIEGKNAVVDAKLTTIIKRLLDQADLQLFEDSIKERAG